MKFLILMISVSVTMAATAAGLMWFWGLVTPHVGHQQVLTMMSFWTLALGLGIAFAPDPIWKK